MAEIYLPTLHAFVMDNIFTGSLGLLRFRVAPTIVMESQKEVNLAESSMTAEYWHGPYCYEKSAMEGKRTFPLSEAGLAEMKAWLEAQV